MRYQIGIGLFLIGIALLVVQLLGMTGITRKLWPSREMSLTIMILVVAGGALRRNGRKGMM